MKYNQLNHETWTVVYHGKKADVAGIYGEDDIAIFQTMSKSGALTGWRYGNNLAAAKKAADEEGM